mgnify:CR=1 FL=1
MGTPMAINIQKAGYPMVVYDAREEAAIPMLEGGAKLADSPAATAESGFRQANIGQQHQCSAGLAVQRPQL